MANANHTEKKQENFVRILGTDINSNRTLLYGFSNLKGVGFTFSNAMCHILKMDRNDKVSSLTDKHIEKIEDFLLNPQKNGLPSWILNKRSDHESGSDIHLAGKDIDFDLIKHKRKLNKIKTYKGQRTRLGLTVRGQRTRSNFRKNKTRASMKSKSIGGKK